MESGDSSAADDDAVTLAYFLGRARVEAADVERLELCGREVGELVVAQRPGAALRVVGQDPRLRGSELGKGVRGIRAVHHELGLPHGPLVRDGNVRGVEVERAGKHGGGGGDRNHSQDL